MRIIVAGTGAVALPSLTAFAAAGHEIVAVLTRPDTAQGRGRRIVRGAVAAWADDQGIAVLQPRSLDDAAQRELADLAPECCPVISYGTLIPPAALTLPTYGWINLHFSLLPAWRGAAPVQHAIMAGDDMTGVSVFQIEAGLDTGPVFATMTERIHPDDTSGALVERLAQAGAPLMVQVVTAVASGQVTAVPQSTNGVSHAHKLNPEDARVRWDLPAPIVDRRIRALTPAPGAWSMWQEQRLGIGPVTSVASGDDHRWGVAVPGAVRATKHIVAVGTASGWVRLGQVQPAGKRPMLAADWARGAHLEPDAQFN